MSRDVAMGGWDKKQVDTWHRLYERVTGILARFGIEDSSGDGDYWVNENNLGWRRVTVEVQALKMLQPDILDLLRDALRETPDWEIVIAVTIPADKKGIWPPMGVTIRAHEIIDGLQRQYLPPEFKDFKIPGSRPGTGYD